MQGWVGRHYQEDSVGGAWWVRVGLQTGVVRRASCSVEAAVCGRHWQGCRRRRRPCSSVEAKDTPRLLQGWLVRPWC